MQIQQDHPWTGVYLSVALVVDEFERPRPVGDDVQVKFLCCLLFQSQTEEVDIRRVIVYDEYLPRAGCRSAVVGDLWVGNPRLSGGRG